MKILNSRTSKNLKKEYQEYRIWMDILMLIQDNLLNFKIINIMQLNLFLLLEIIFFLGLILIEQEEIEMKDMKYINGFGMVG